MTITTPEIQARHALRRAQATDYIEWALGMLESKADSSNLRILAGLDRSVSPFEAEEHFCKAREELALPTPDREQAMLGYALQLAESILEPASDYRALVAKLSELCYTNDYPHSLVEWHSLDAGLTNIQEGQYPYGYERLYQANPRQIVTEVALEFISQYKEPVLRNTMTIHDFTTTRSIAATPEKVWQAMVDPTQVAQYHLAPLTAIELTEGGRIRYGTDEAEMIAGRVLEVIPGRRLVHTFRFGAALEGTTTDPETTVSYLLEAENGGTKLTLVHSGFPDENQTYANISGGWPHILDALKAFLENE